MRRRTFLKTLTASALALPFYQFLANPKAHAFNGTARRLIVLYFPDGVPGPSQDGDPSLWHCAGSERSFTMPSLLDPLIPHKDDCVFFNGIDMGRTDEGSHPGGAKKLLTGVDGGGGESIDQYLARTAGAAAPHKHIYLGAQANLNGAQDDKHISYVGPGRSVAPEDNPVRAFERYFMNGAVNNNGGANGGQMTAQDLAKKSVIDRNIKELEALKARLGNTEQDKLKLHLEALRDVEQRLVGMELEPPDMPATCAMPSLDNTGYNDTRVHEPDMFPSITRMQIDVMVQAMACNLSRVGVVQCSSHTSELIMSRFMNTALYDPNYDMRSHQASHYGPRHDQSKREFTDYVAQRRWFVQQFAYLLDALKSRPEGEGSMLDYSMVLLCTEVCDGNTHSHSNMPFILAGKGAGAINTGRLLQYTNNDRNSNLFVALARAMGDGLQNFGQGSYGPLYNLLANA